MISTWSSEEAMVDDTHSMQVDLTGDVVYPMQLDLTSDIVHPMQLDLTADVVYPMQIDSSSMLGESHVLMNAISIVLNWISVASIVDVAYPMQLDTPTLGPRLVLTRATNT